MARWRIRVVARNSTGVLDGPPQFLSAVDYDYHAPGRLYPTGIVEITDNPARALTWPDKESAFEAWRRQSTSVPLRTDGRPNRPLTAFTIAIEEAT